MEKEKEVKEQERTYTHSPKFAVIRSPGTPSLSNFFHHGTTIGTRKLL